MPDDGCEDDRLVCEVLAAQLEFADLIVVNRAEVLCNAEAERLRRLLHALNPAARVLMPVAPGSVSALDLLSSSRFDPSRTPQGAGWLAALQSRAEGAVVPSPSGAQHDTDAAGPSSSSNAGAQHDGEAGMPSSNLGGVSMWVYRARRPFHPLRLRAFILRQGLALRQPDWSVGGAAAHVCDDPSCGDARHRLDAPAEASAEPNPNVNSTGGASTSLPSDMSRSRSLPLANASGASPPLGRPLLRSRGYVWLAGAARTDHCAEWSQIGSTLTLGTGGPWYCVLPRWASGSNG